MSRRRDTGRRSPPDRAPILLECFERAVAQLGRPERLIIGGKSMGGRIASMVADELGVAGVVCLGYPFHPPAQPDKTRVEHLRAIKTRCLIVQGSRDPFGTESEVSGYALGKKVKVSWLEGGNHDLVKPGKVWDRAMRQVAKFIAR
jgi:uncharacterized protein